ncbi:hypothetical protein [Marinivivus vitaminiproducens]|uniref:hypothetical protein n=1 Tax=Marinivivus vitaminiproducens TaxID=3035935 RepID=UPI0027998E51|nr:hypothetical protein P4R82_25280 [Geminicoccaceae bacterium SCSIO 64248]
MSEPTSPSALRDEALGHVMMMEGGMSWMMGGMAVIALLVVSLLVLGIAALVKYVFGRSR